MILPPRRHPLGTVTRVPCGHGVTVPSHPRIFIGLDLGLRQDHSALALIERARLETGEFDRVHWQPVTRQAFILRALHKWPLRTPYLEVARQVAALLAAHKNPTLAIDAAGPGAPLLELLRARPARASIEPVIITSGAQPGVAKDSTQLIPRDCLLARLRIALERRLLLIPPSLPLRRELGEELAALGNPSNRRHDDLAIALALAAHSAARGSSPAALVEPA